MKAVVKVFLPKRTAARTGKEFYTQTYLDVGPKELVMVIEKSFPGRLVQLVEMDEDFKVAKEKLVAEMRVEAEWISQQLTGMLTQMVRNA